MFLGVRLPQLVDPGNRQEGPKLEVTAFGM